MRLLRLATLILCVTACLHAGVIYSVTDLGVLPGGTYSSATGLSSSGRVTGYGDTTSNQSAAFVWNGSLANVGPPGSPLAIATAINASGQIVGYAFAPDFSTFRAFLYDGSKWVTIPTLGGAN